MSVLDAAREDRALKRPVATGNADGGEPLWRVQDVARFLQITVNAVYKMVERREIPHIRLGRKVLFDPAAVRRWLEEHAVPVEGRRP